MEKPLVPILMFHKVASCPTGSKVPGHYVSAKLFRRQMLLIRRLGFRTVSLDRLFASPLPRRPIVITFDDGYQNYYENALPTLEEFGFSATVFCVSGLAGDINWWDVDRGDVQERLMTEEQMREVVKRGTEIGSHTVTHADLSAVGEDRAWREISDSKTQLEQILGHEVTTFCYPYGRKTQSTEELVRQAGYRIACSTVRGVNSPQTNRFALKRVNVRKDTTPAILLYKLLRDFRSG